LVSGRGFISPTAPPNWERYGKVNTPCATLLKFSTSFCCNLLIPHTMIRFDSRRLHQIFYFHKFTMIIALLSVQYLWTTFAIRHLTRRAVYYAPQRDRVNGCVDWERTKGAIRGYYRQALFRLRPEESVRLSTWLRFSVKHMSRARREHGTPSLQVRLTRRRIQWGATEFGGQTLGGCGDSTRFAGIGAENSGCTTDGSGANGVVAEQSL
jgi:hypothetical protein